MKMGMNLLSVVCRPQVHKKHIRTDHVRRDRGTRPEVGTRTLLAEGIEPYQWRSWTSGLDLRCPSH